MSDQSTTNASSDIQPLHQQQPAALSKPFLRNKSLMSQNFASPTDSMMSPCTAKLQAHKNKHLQRTKPQMLSFEKRLQEKPVETTTE